MSDSFSVTVNAEIYPVTFVKEKVSGLAADVMEKVPEFAKPIVIVIAMVLIAIGFGATSGAEAIGAVAAFLLIFIPKLIKG